MAMVEFSLPLTTPTYLHHHLHVFHAAACAFSVECEHAAAIAGGAAGHLAIPDFQVTDCILNGGGLIAVQQGAQRLCTCQCSLRTPSSFARGKCAKDSTRPKNLSQHIRIRER
jgi:hypothetical protein